MIPIGPNTGDISYYLARRLDRDSKLGVMRKDLWTNVVSIILENVSGMWVGAFSISPLLPTYTYKIFAIDSSLLGQKSRPFCGKSYFIKGGRNLNS